MKKYLTLQQASKKISNLCKAIGDLDCGVLGAEPKFVSALLKSGYKSFWISKLTGLLYFVIPRFEGNYLKVVITCHEDKYELELL